MPRRIFTCENCHSLMFEEEPKYYVCPTCGCTYQYNKHERAWIFYDNGEINEDDEDYEDYYGGEDYLGRPAVCTGCGSDMYPDCQYSCNRFDDD